MFRKAFAAYVAVSSLSAVAAAQTAAPAAQTVQAQTPTQTQCALPSVADSVDLKEIPGTNLLTVPVKINGTDKEFLLDIGTNLTEVSHATVSQLALPDVSKAPSDYANWYPGVDIYKEMTGKANFDMNVTTQAAYFNVKSATSDQHYRPRVRVASFAMGDGTGHNLVFVVAKDEEMGKAKSKPYDGLMTGDFFRQYDVELYPAVKKLSYLTPTNCTDPLQIAYWPHKEVAVIPMTVEDDGRMHVQVMVQGHVINAVIDTSSDHTVMRRGVAEQMLGFSADKDMKPDGSRVDGMGQQIYIHTFPQITFAGGVVAVNVPTDIQNYTMIHDLNRTPVLGSRATFSNAPDIPDLTLGMDVLQQLHLLIAPGRKNIYVTQE